jgi:hypothetical protein
MKCCVPVLTFFMFAISSMAEMLAINFHQGLRGPQPSEEDDGRTINGSGQYFEQLLSHFTLFDERMWLQVCVS